MTSRKYIEDSVKFFVILNGAKYNKKLESRLRPIIRIVQDQIEEHKLDEDYVAAFRKVFEDNRLERCSSSMSPAQVFKKTKKLDFFRDFIVCQCHACIKNFVSEDSKGNRPNLSFVYEELKEELSISESYIKKIFESRTKRGGFFGKKEEKLLCSRSTSPRQGA